MTSRAGRLSGALVVCALSLAAFGAASASAEGLTAVTCIKVPAGTGHFETSHCETPQVETGNFETLTVPEGTRVTGSAVGVSVFHFTFSLAKVTVTCKEAKATGKVKNTEEGGEHKAHYTEVVVHFTGCWAHLESKPEGEACKIESISGEAGKPGTIQTFPLTATTGKEHKVTFRREAESETVAEFNILKEAEPESTCSLPKGKVTITGTTIADANTEKHSHLTFTGEGALKANGAEMKLTGTWTTYMEEANGEPGNTVGLTTF